MREPALFFTSLAAVVQGRPLRFAPTFLLRDKYDNLERIASVDAPLLVVRVDGDGLIPASDVPLLLAAARCPLPLASLPGVPHLALGNVFSGRAQPALTEVLKARCGLTGCPAAKQ